MKNFLDTLTYINKTIYEPKNLYITSIQEEKQNSDYDGCVFKLSSKTIRFRSSKITPKKIGQFVAFWEKDINNKNRPFLFEQSPELFVITSFKNDNDFGQFVFPKEVLLKNNILRSNSTKGKMGIRVYPSWDNPTSKQAVNTQK